MYQLASVDDVFSPLCYLLVVTTASENVLPQLSQVAVTSVRTDAQIRVQLHAQGLRCEPRRGADLSGGASFPSMSGLNRTVSASTPRSL